jgi:hypothetical protein
VNTLFYTKRNEFVSTVSKEEYFNDNVATFI